MENRLSAKGFPTMRAHCVLRPHLAIARGTEQRHLGATGRTGSIVLTDSGTAIGA